MGLDAIKWAFGAQIDRSLAKFVLVAAADLAATARHFRRRRPPIGVAGSRRARAFGSPQPPLREGQGSSRVLLSLHEGPQSAPAPHNRA